MRWIFAVIGMVLGAVAAGFGGALTGAVLGFGFGWLVSERPARPRAPGDAWEIPAGTAQGATQDAAGQAPLPLAARVANLERELAALRGELAQLRGAAGAQALQDPAVAQPSSSATEAGEMPVRVPVLVPVPAAAAAPPSIAMPAAIPVPPVVAQPPVSPAVVPPAPPLSTPLGPQEPDFVQRALSAARDWLLGGNSVVRVGVLILFFGVAFLLKYASDNAMLPVEFRLAGVAAGAVALLAMGWLLRERRATYALVLQGGGVGVLYLTVFAATKLYGLLPAAAAFPLLVAICVLAGGLAVLQNAAVLAFTGSAGGFLAPVLISTGGGSHVMLFSYYALLNAGIFAIAWFRAWRQLNLLGFAFTFGIGTAWGAFNYRPALLASTEPFLILFFLMYTGIALLYALRRQVSLKDYVDGTLVFGTPLLAMGLQAALVRNIPFAMAWSAVALAAFYLGLAAWLSARRERLGLLFEAMLALGVIFATLAVPLAFDGRTTSAVWAVEGAAVVWLGVRQQRRLALASGLLLQLAGGMAFAAGSLSETARLEWPVLNSRYIGTLLLAGSGIFSGWRLHGRPEARAWYAPCAPLGLAAAGWGLLWWLGGGVAEILHWHMQRGWQPRALLELLALFVALGGWLAHLARRGLAWPLAGMPALAVAPLLAVLAALSCAARLASPLAGTGALAWLAVFAATYVLLRRLQDDVPDALLAPHHALLFGTLCMLLTTEGYWRLRAYVPEGAWSWSAWAYGYGALLALLSAWGWRLRWPVARFARAYLLWGAAPLAALLWLWSVASVASDGDAAPLFYLPLLNPLDVAQLLAALALVLWLRRLAALGLAGCPRVLEYAALATAFLWFNAVLLRTLHHHFGIGYGVADVLRSLNLQLVFLAGWSAFALAGMVWARRDSLLRLFAVASAPLVVLMWLWTLYANLTQAGATLGRVPLLNPLDLVQVLVYGVAMLWLARARRIGMPVEPYADGLRGIAAATLFVWLNAMLLRTLHHWSGVPYTLQELGASTLVQASLSVFWTVLALIVMVAATRRGTRVLWFVGGALLGVTVIKLFLLDLSFVKGIERIISFIGVGVLLLLIGYFSPLPPKAKEAA
ncbi:DUF2339 domain-containing protein [Cupriavidus sp. 2TAF22]|uniref:DUF2339 domain-containing protein n=1 Tax=unclassified Cupriavidus TaxID=2640874 RepID=UPI003F9392D8